MKIVNETAYPTGRIRQIAIRVLRDMNHETVERMMRVHIRVKYGRHATGAWVGGYAWINSSSMVLKMPAKKVGYADPRDLAHTIDHEWAHCCGMKHKDMKGYRRGFDDARYDWAKDYQIRLRVPRKPERGDLRLVRFERAQANLKKAETRLKRAKTLRDKWYNKVRYYEKVLAATSTPNEV